MSGLSTGSQTNGAWLEGVRGVRLWFSVIARGLAGDEPEPFRKILASDIDILEGFLTDSKLDRQDTPLKNAEALANPEALEHFRNHPALS